MPVVTLSKCFYSLHLPLAEPIPWWRQIGRVREDKVSKVWREDVSSCRREDGFFEERRSERVTGGGGIVPNGNGRGQCVPVRLRRNHFTVFKDYKPIDLTSVDFCILSSIKI